MKQEDKDLLLRDLCARLPYGVKVKVTPVPSEEYNHIFFNAKIVDININYIGVLSDNNFVFQQDIVELKPYLFPLSSMTEEQKEEYGKCYDIDLANSAKNLYNRLDGKDTINGYPMYNHIDWCNKNHFDYRGLIPMGLATDATGLNIY